MGRIRDAFDVLTGRAEAKALARMPQPGAGGGGGPGQLFGWNGWYAGNQLPPGSKADYAKEAGDLWRSTVVTICLGWLQDNVLTAELEVCKKAAKKGQPDEPIVGHKLAHRLMVEPNPHMTADELWDLIVLSFKCDGNVYLIKAKGIDGEPLQLWWAAPWTIWPRWDPGNPYSFIDWYDYRVDDRLYRLDPSDVVHIRASPDPYNNRLGCARLKHVIRNIVGLNRAETYTSAIIGNGGLWKVFVPSEDTQVDEAQADGIKRHYERATKDENAGRIPVLNTAGTFQDVGSGPQELALDTILDRPEANVCGALGVNPMIVALAVGAAMRSYANQKEANKQSWENGLVPMQDRIARALGRQLLPDFGDPAGLVLSWERLKVAALQEDATDKTTRAVAMRGGKAIATENEARAVVGLPPVPGGDVSPSAEEQAAADRAAAIAGDGGNDQSNDDAGDGEGAARDAA
jgi:HK97 family phage portal protein